MEEAIKKYAPIFHLHPEDKYLPSSFQWFLERSELRVRQGQEDNVLLREGTVTQEGLIAAQEQNDPGQLHLWIRDEHHHGQALEDINSVPVYVHYKLIVGPDGDESRPEAWEVTYITFYPYNGAYPLCGLPCLRAGGHIGDIEHLTVRLSPDTLQLQGIWFNSHRSREGEWCPAEEVMWDPQSGRPLAFVARNGHGLYPRPGTVPRLFFVANDYSSAVGPAWSPSRLVLMRGTDILKASGAPYCKAVSRGCSLPEPQATAVEGTEVALPLQPGEQQQQQQQGAQDGVCGAAGCCSYPELVEDFSLWQRFKGYWGTSQSPCQQGWFWRAEPPVSRGWFRRLLHPLAPEVHSLHPATTAA